MIPKLIASFNYKIANPLEPFEVAEGIMWYCVFWFPSEFHIEMENYFLVQGNKYMPLAKYIFNLNLYFDPIQNIQK